MRWLVAAFSALVLVALAMLWLQRSRPDSAAAPRPAPFERVEEVDTVLREPAELEQPERAAVAHEDPPTEDVAEPDLPPEEMEEPWYDDPVQLGPAALDLRLVDARSGEPVSSQVELWRIDAPGNEHWTEGDQLQQVTHVPAEGFYFTRLPAGLYRLVCHAQTWDAQPPEITVTAPRTRLDVPIEVPERFRVRVVVRDRFGRLVPMVSFGQERTERLQLSQSWRFERIPRNGDIFLMDEEIFDESSLQSSEGPQLPEGFALGLYGGATRGEPRVRILVLETPEKARVSVRVPARAEGDVDLVAVALPPGELAGRVLFPGGAPAQAEISVVGEAVQREPGLPDGGWERAPVRIRVSLSGYEPVDELWTVASGELPWIALEPLR